MIFTALHSFHLGILGRQSLPGSDIVRPSITSHPVCVLDGCSDPSMSLFTGFVWNLSEQSVILPHAGAFSAVAKALCIRSLQSPATVCFFNSIILISYRYPSFLFYSLALSCFSFLFNSHHFHVYRWIDVLFKTPASECSGSAENSLCPSFRESNA